MKKIFRKMFEKGLTKTASILSDCYYRMSVRFYVATGKRTAMLNDWMRYDGKYIQKHLNDEHGTNIEYGYISD